MKSIEVVAVPTKDGYRRCGECIFLGNCHGKVDCPIEVSHWKIKKRG
jgi:hypothetical protein